MDDSAAVATSELAHRTEERRLATSSALDPAERGELGQFFTPAPAADFIASLPRIPEAEELRILDPGAGVGSLSAAIIARIIREQPQMRIRLTACEIATELRAPLEATLDDCVSTARACQSDVETTVEDESFVTWAAEKHEAFDLVIMNPPYRKLSASSKERKMVDSVCSTETSNLYSAFMALGVSLLKDGGQLVAITPRSFTSGPYFRSFRQYFLKHMHLDRVHLFEARNKIFADASVLQENVIFSAVRKNDVDRDPVTVSSSITHDGEVRTRSVPYGDMVYQGDKESFIHISADEEDTELSVRLASLPASLEDLGLKVSTGRVVDFRSREHLRPDPVDGSVPLIYPLHMRDGSIRWPSRDGKKNNAIMLNEETRKMTFPSGHYVVVKRLSSKEEKRRVQAAVFDPSEVARTNIGFENHVNVFHDSGAGLSRDVARGLCLWLNSTLLDKFIRRFNGHTQVNATDLRSLRYPSREQLSAIGGHWPEGVWLDQQKIDDLVEQHLEPESPNYLL